MCVCVCLESLPVEEGGRELVHCSLSQLMKIILLLEVCVQRDIECLNLCMLIQYIIKLSEAVVHMLHCTCIASSFPVFFCWSPGEFPV